MRDSLRPVSLRPVRRGTDHICHGLCRMCTAAGQRRGLAGHLELPVTLAFTDVGFTPLRADTTIIIPYEEMSRAQLDAIAEAVRTMQQHGSYSSSVQMGGGLYVRSVRACI